MDVFFWKEFWLENLFSIFTDLHIAISEKNFYYGNFLIMYSTYSNLIIAKVDNLWINFNNLNFNFYQWSKLCSGFNPQLKIQILYLAWFGLASGNPIPALLPRRAPAPVEGVAKFLISLG